MFRQAAAVTIATLALAAAAYTLLLVCLAPAAQLERKTP